MASLERVHVFLDTNAALHFRRADQIDWLQLTGAKAVVLVVTPIFLRELEKHKVFHPRRQIKDRAGATVQWLAPFVRGESKPELRPGVTLSFVANEPVLDYVAHDLDRALSDDVLIASVLTYDPIDRSLIRVTTADVGLELKLRSRGLVPLVFPDDLRLPEEQDPLKQELEKARRELAQLKLRQPHLALSFGDDETLGHLKACPRNLSEYKVQEPLEEVRRKYPPVSVLRPSSANATGSRLVNDLAQLAALANPLMDPERAEAHNEQLRQFYQRYAAYLESYREWVENDARTFEFVLTLHNSGNAIATDIDVTLRFPKAIAVMTIDDRPKAPNVPSPPRIPSIIDLLTRGDYGIMPEAIWRPSIDFPSLDYNGRVRVNAERGTVSFSVKSLKHHHLFRLDPFLARFVSQDVIGSFLIDYRITGVELPTPHDGTLHFVLA